MDYIAERAPEGRRCEHRGSVAADEEFVWFDVLSETEEIGSMARKSAWARVYEIYALVCP